MFGNPNSNSKELPTKKVSELFLLQMGKTPARNTPSYWDSEDHKWISIADMSNYGRYTDQTSEYITDKAVKESGIKVYPKGTVIMSFKLTIGKIAITSENIYSNEAIVGFIPKDNSYSTEFLYDLVKNYDWLENAAQAVKGKTLNKESIGANSLIIPPMEDQNKWIEISKQADKSKFSRIKSRFIEMFGEAKWQKSRLADLVDPACPISYGIVQPDSNGECTIPIVRPVDLNDDLYVRRNGLKCTTEDISNAYKRTILRGDELLLCVRGTTGLMGIATEELKGGNVTRGITPLYFKGGVNRFYVLGAFLSDEIQTMIR